MADNFIYISGALIALAATCLIAFPERFLPEIKARRKKLSARHWGVYEGNDSYSAEQEEEGIVVEAPARKMRAAVGSQSYSGGRSISFRT